MSLSTASWNSRCSCGSGFLLLDVFKGKPLWSNKETIQGLKDPYEYSSRIYSLCWQYLTQDLWEVHRLYEVSPFTWQLPSDDCWFLLVFSICEYFHFNGCRISHIFIYYFKNCQFTRFSLEMVVVFTFSTVTESFEAIIGLGDVRQILVESRTSGVLACGKA